MVDGGSEVSCLRGVWFSGLLGGGFLVDHHHGPGRGKWSAAEVELTPDLRKRR